MGQQLQYLPIQGYYIITIFYLIAYLSSYREKAINAL